MSQKNLEPSLTLYIYRVVKPEKFLPSTCFCHSWRTSALINSFRDSENQATGLERFELLGKLEGVDVFDMKPLQVDRLGTMKEPIKVYSLVSEMCLLPWLNGRIRDGI